MYIDVDSLCVLFLNSIFCPNGLILGPGGIPVSSQAAMIPIIRQAIWNDNSSTYFGEYQMAWVVSNIKHFWIVSHFFG